MFLQEMSGRLIEEREMLSLGTRSRGTSRNTSRATSPTQTKSEFSCSQLHNLITKTCLYNIDPLKPHILYSKTGVYRGILYFFSFLLKSLDCGYSLEPPRRGGSNEYPQSMF